ncbi:hypothetical protein ABU614_02785 [Lysobacter firmicutimachus]|uniref:HEAT repeat domain-containing protein n=1 Tax=Lysobacter firmicutimachus TaxID=1792846 RepID=A0AAU8MUT5_9GAMM
MPLFQNGWTKGDIETAIGRDRPDELLHVPIMVSMDPPDCAWAEAVCLSLARHPHVNVRGNAVLGLGHLARTCGRLDLSAVVPVLCAALKDPAPYVRDQAETAADDLSHFLDIVVPRPFS